MNEYVLRQRDKALRHSKFENILGSVLVILIFWAPTSFMLFKLALMCMLIIINLFRHRYTFLPRTSIVYLILGIILLDGAWGLLNGVLHQNLSDSQLISTAPFHLVWPVLLFLLFPCIRGEERIESLGNIIVVSHILIMLYLLYNFYAMFTGLPVLQIKSEDEVFLYEGRHLGISTNNMHQLIFTTPFFFTLGFMGRFNKRVFIIIGIVTLLVNFYTRRTALLVVNAYCLIFIPFVLYYFFKYRLKGIKRLTVILCMFVLVIGAYIYQNSRFFKTSFEYYANHFNPETDIRYNQREALTKAWLSSPITGVGAGTKIHTYERGWDTGFESTYHSALAYNGLIGFGLFVLHIYLTLLYLYRKGKMYQNPFYIAFLMGLCMFLIAATTNPVMGTFDRLVPLYICIACLLPELKSKTS